MTKKSTTAASKTLSAEKAATKSVTKKATVSTKSPRELVLAAMKKPQGVRRTTVQKLFGWERGVTPYDIRAFAKRHRPLKLKVTMGKDGHEVYRLSAS